MQAPETSRTTRPPLRLEEIFSEIQDELGVVEQIIRSRVESKLELVEQSSHYVYQSGGKRVRPALLLLSAKLFGYTGKQAAEYASVMEFIHTATLVHDDIVDDAHLRRGQTSVNSLLGNDVTVLLGDYLYIRSIGLAIEMGNLQILELICEMTLRMIEGMILEITRGGDVRLNEKEYLEILKRKTAYLFSACGHIGAVLAEAPEPEARILADYGMNLGMAFQVVDDLLDFTADQKVLGKPVLSDLKEGHVTLPIIYALHAEPSSAATVERVLQEGAIDEPTRNEILDLVRRSRAIEKARRAAEDYAAESKRVLEPLPESIYKESLLALADYVVDRNR